MPTTAATSTRGREARNRTAWLLLRRCPYIRLALAASVPTLIPLVTLHLHYMSKIREKKTRRRRKIRTGGATTMTRHSTPGRRRRRRPQLLAPLPFDAGPFRASQRPWAGWAWPGAATMESELETRVSTPVVFVNCHDLYVIVAVLGVAILGCACVLAYSFSNFAMLIRNAEEVRSYITSRTNSTDPFGGSNLNTDHLRRSITHKDAIKADFLDIRRRCEFGKDAIKPPFLDIRRG
ncbi:hypothetical protein HPB51_007617 [Rhipicephalus microplus]|uniref:Uncharacterized protein n=1 Tax=Rhipicephalus microplus TaxID=6941 RepID=A0A9J6ERY4_RHIMP|nr:hypothetical protein HPB51_007617 [Rhipicephalus microplus]